MLYHQTRCRSTIDLEERAEERDRLRAEDPALRKLGAVGSRATVSSTSIKGRGAPSGGPEDLAASQVPTSRSCPPDVSGAKVPKGVNFNGSLKPVEGRLIPDIPVLSSDSLMLGSPCSSTSGGPSPVLSVSSPDAPLPSSSASASPPEDASPPGGTLIPAANSVGFNMQPELLLESPAESSPDMVTSGGGIGATLDVMMQLPPRTNSHLIAPSLSIRQTSDIASLMTTLAPAQKPAHDPMAASGSGERAFGPREESLQLDEDSFGIGISRVNSECLEDGKQESTDGAVGPSDKAAGTSAVYDLPNEYAKSFAHQPKPQQSFRRPQQSILAAGMGGAGEHEDEGGPRDPGQAFLNVDQSTATIFAIPPPPSQMPASLLCYMLVKPAQELDNGSTQWQVQWQRLPHGNPFARSKRPGATLDHSVVS
eukprot:gene4730-4908_t